MADYSRAWKLRRILKTIPWISFIITAALLVAVGNFHSLRFVENFYIHIWIALILIFAIANIKIAFFKCPRCHKKFNSSIMKEHSYSYRGDLGKACGNCGLKEYENS